MAKAKVTTTGGRAFGDVLKNARRNRGRVVEVGIHSDAVPYPDGVQVALTGLLHEYGLGEHTERPWFRSAVIEIKRELQQRKMRTLSRGGGLSERDAEQIAELAVSRIKESIRAFDLIDTGRLLHSIKAIVKRL